LIANITIIIVNIAIIIADIATTAALTAIHQLFVTIRGKLIKEVVPHCYADIQQLFCV
jgi:hypothetical protein